MPNIAQDVTSAIISPAFVQRLCSPCGPLTLDRCNWIDR